MQTVNGRFYTETVACFKISKLKCVEQKNMKIRKFSCSLHEPSAPSTPPHPNILRGISFSLQLLSDTFTWHKHHIVAKTEAIMWLEIATQHALFIPFTLNALMHCL